MSFSLAQIARLGGQLALPADTAGYLILAVTEQCLAGAHADGTSIVLEDSGAVTVHPNGAPPCTTKTLASLLARLLSGALGENLGLTRCATETEADLADFAGHLRAALVPLNRPAARRALQRLHRQLERLGPVPLEAAPSPEPAAAPAAECEPEPTAVVEVAPRLPELPSAAPTTPRLGSLVVAPHQQGRTPGALPEPVGEGERTQALWPTEEDAPEATRPFELLRRASPVAVVAAAPPARRSDVRELVRGFRVEPAPSQAQLLEALQQSVESQGTPLPPATSARRAAGR